MAEINERIKKIKVILCDNNNTLFAQKLCISTSQASNISNGSTSVGKKIIDHILEVFPQVNRVWLITGEGDMLKGGVVTQTNNGSIAGDMVAGNKEVTISDEEYRKLNDRIFELQRQLKIAYDTINNLSVVIARTAGSETIQSAINILKDSQDSL